MKQAANENDLFWNIAVSVTHSQTLSQTQWRRPNSNSMCVEVPEPSERI